MPLAFARQRKNYEPAQEMVANTIRGSGRFTTAGAGAPTVFSTGPWTITKGGAAGRYTVTGTEQGVELLAADASLWQNTAGTAVALVVLSTPAPTAGASPKTPWSFDIETQSVAGTAANLTGPVVTFDIALRKGRLTK